MYICVNIFVSDLFLAQLEQLIIRLCPDQRPAQDLTQQEREQNVLGGRCSEKHHYSL